jgi:hypothetical protein
MATSILIEEEHGTYAGAQHPHNGYYAGDFSVYAVDRPVPPPHATVLGRRRPELVLSH